MKCRIGCNRGLIITAVVIILSLLSLFFVEQGEVVLWVNGHRNGFFDAVMPYVTFLGNGLFYGLATLILLAWYRQAGILLMIAGIAHATVSYMLKKLVFGPLPRPITFFEEGQLDLIHGVEYVRLFSFPSGHSMTVFTLATLLGLTVVSAKHQWVLVGMASLVAFSRIYLLQHFYRDVVAGAMIGTFIAVLCYCLMASKWRRIEEESEK